MVPISILIGGDLVPTKSNIHLFSKGEIGSLLDSSLLNLFNSVDFRIFNLEVPLVDGKKPIKKCGPNLSAPTSTIKGIKELKPTLISLANNHILDQDEQGLFATMDLLNKNGIESFGAGKNLNEACRPFIIEKAGKKIGIYACAEYEFTIATKTKAGANPFDPLESLDHINSLKSICDYVIVLYHGGKEHYRYPSPYLQKVCRKITEKGADIVICQHSHCIGAYEEYNTSTIIYGQGNFLFDYSNNEFWQTSILINIKIRDRLDIEYTPIVKKGNAVHLAEEEVSKEILSAFYKRSNEMLTEGFIEKQYEKFAKKNIDEYLRCFSGVGKWLSRLDRYLLMGSLVKYKYSKKKLLVIQNFIECEAHRELILAGLKGENLNERRKSEK
jgi:hypothetical protein